jgi:hypothetical protein
MPMTTTASDDPKSPRDIQTFHFTHLEMCIISVALSTFHWPLSEKHIQGHLLTGECNKGEATIIAMSTNIQSVLNDHMDPERMNALMDEIIAGKYS